MMAVHDDSLTSRYYNHCVLPNGNDTFNTTNVLSADDIAVEQVEAILYGILMPVLSGLGIIGNILNLVVLTRPNLMKIITYTYFRAMACSDLLTMLMVIPFVLEVTGHKFTSYLGVLFQAHFVLPCLNALVGSSVLAIVAVTFERWLSICHPIQAKNIQSPLRAKLIITAAWIISFILFLPYCFRKHVTICLDPVTGRHVYEIAENWAYTHSTGYNVYGWIRESCLRLIPMVLLSGLNIRIVFALRQVQHRRRRLKGGGQTSVNRTRNSIQRGSKSEQGTRKKSTDGGLSRTSSLRQSMHSTPAQKAEYRRLQEERRLVLLLIGIVVMFLVCITPAAILLILPIPDEEFGFGLKLFRAVANLLELTNYALNFYVYVGCSSDFRSTFVNVFCQHYVRKKAKENGEKSFGTTLAAGRIATESSRVTTVAPPSQQQPTVTSTPAGSQQASNSNTPTHKVRNNRLVLPGHAGASQNLTESQSLLQDSHDV